MKEAKYFAIVDDVEPGAAEIRLETVYSDGTRREYLLCFSERWDKQILAVERILNDSGYMKDVNVLVIKPSDVPIYLASPETFFEVRQR